LTAQEFQAKHMALKKVGKVMLNSQEKEIKFKPVEEKQH